MQMTELCQSILDEKKLVGQDGCDITYTQAFRLYTNGCSDQIFIAPPLTPVDMSVFIDSGIDCELHDVDDEEPYISPLTSCPTPSATSSYRDIRDVGWRYCRPRQKYWHSLRNCERRSGWVVGSTDAVHAFRDAGFVVAQSSDGQHLQFDGVLEGRCYPWEAK